MKAFSLTQPWATLVVIGAKKFETRSWATSFRDRFLVHASKGFPKWARECCEEPFFREALSAAGYPDWKALPVGALIGTATLADCIRTEDARPDEREEAFGDYAPGRFAYRLEDSHKWPTPFPCTGALGFWNVPPEVMKMISDGAIHIDKPPSEPTLF